MWMGYNIISRFCVRSIHTYSKTEMEMLEETFPFKLTNILHYVCSTHYLIRWNWYLVVDNKSLYFNSDGNSSCWRQHFHVFGNNLMFNKQICFVLYRQVSLTKSNTSFIYIFYVKMWNSSLSKIICVNVEWCCRWTFFLNYIFVPCA